VRLDNVAVSNPSHEYRFVYLAPPRTGSRRIFGALQRDYGCLGGDDRGTYRSMSHRMEIPPGCEDYQTVATIRNPFSRMVSCWNWLRDMKNPPPNNDVIRFLIENQSKRPSEFWDFVRVVEATPGVLLSQMTQFRTIWPDHFVRYETALASYRALPWVSADATFHTVPQDPRTAAWQDQYDEATRAIVMKIWHIDFERLDYSSSW